MNCVSNYVFGIKTLPLTLAATIVTTTFGKMVGQCNETIIGFLWESFQKDQDRFFATIAPEAGIDPKSGLLGKAFFILISNQFMPFVEELLFRSILQNKILTFVFNKIGLSEQTSALQIVQENNNLKKGERNKRYKPQQVHTSLSDQRNFSYQTIARIGITAILFAIPHLYSERVNSPHLSKAELRPIENSDYLTAMGTGFVFGAVYEWAGQNIFAAWGAHAMWNMFIDAVRF
ncbi:MAG: hypothetical protein K1000chlam3_01664 [Chlamydiae bacterium]|nr:hypothetical protein [Chlamydiota bacterium]